MGCGSSVAQVSDSIKEGLFKPLRLLQVEREGDAVETEGRVFLFGETRTQRKILELQLMAGCAKAVSSRVRIPVPRITYDPIELMYEESQEIFHLGVYGLSVQPPFNRMLALWLQSNIIMLSGGRDFDGYNIKNEAFYYSIVEEGKEGQAELTVRTDAKTKYSGNKFQKIASMTSRRYGHMGIYIQKLKSVLVFGGINDKEEIVKSCERYGVLDNAWKEISSMNVARAYGHCFQFNNKVYAFGGRSSASKKSKKIEFFDLETYQWEILPFKIHRGIEDALIASLNPNEIIIIGGKTTAGPTKSVIKIDIANQSYSWDSNLNHEYQSVKGARTHSGIIVFGGSKDKIQAYSNGQWGIRHFDHRKLAEQEQMEIFSFSTQSLHVASRKPQFNEQFKVTKEDFILFGNDQCPCLLACDTKEGKVRKGSVSMKCKIRSKMAVVQYEKGKYFLAGGCDWKQKKSFSSCYFYNAETNQTQETVKMSQKKHNFAACHLEGYVYIFGGYDSLDRTSKKSCAKFSLANEGWDFLPTMRRARSRCQALPISQNKIAVFGGVSGGESVLGIEIFHALQRKFDIFEPTLQLPSEILCSYSIPNNEQVILILNKGQTEGSPYQLTTVCLGENPQNTSRSTLNNHSQIVPYQAPKLESSLSKMSSEMSEVEPVVINEPPLGDDNIIRVKPKLVQIKQKKLQSQSSQMNVSQSKEQIDDLDNNFHFEKIDLRKNKTEPIVIAVVSEVQQKEQKKLIIEDMKIEHEISLKIPNNEINKEKIEQQTEQYQIQKKLEASAKEIQAKVEQPKIQQAQIEEQFKVISSRPIDWLSKNISYLVASRLDHIYFLTNTACIQLSKQTGNDIPIDFKNNTKVSIDMIK